MSYDYKVHKEGELYKTIIVGGHSFELRYGYYEEFEKESGEPIVIYPDLLNNPLYDENDYQIVTAIQVPCEYYLAFDTDSLDGCCGDCTYYSDPYQAIGICKCEMCKNNIRKRRVL